jgi:hypothetical protein
VFLTASVSERTLGQKVRSLTLAVRKPQRVRENVVCLIEHHGRHALRAT